MNLNRTTLFTALTVLFLIFAVTSGCGGTTKVSKSNYEKIEDGMTMSEVEKILGKGNEQASSSVDIPGQSFSVPGGGQASVSGVSVSSKVLTWQSGNRVITVMFQNGKVMGKSQVGF